MKIGIIITVKNCVEYTKECIDSIVTDVEHVIILIDDFSTDRTKGYFKTLSNSRDNIIVLTDIDTFSLAEKWNLGIDAAIGDTCDAFLICNNDIVFNKHTINQLADRLRQVRLNNEKIGIITAHNLRDSMGPKEIIDYPLVENGTESAGPDFSCFLLTSDAFAAVGLFDEDYMPCYFEDNDYHIRLIQAGWRAISMTSAPYYHYGSVTQNSTPGGICSGSRFDMNRDYFKAKFGFAPGDPAYQKLVDSLEN